MKLSQVLLNVLGLAAVPFALVLFILACRTFTIVPAGHVGVVTEFGQVKPFVFDEGLHIRSPLTAVRKFSVQTTKTEAEASAASKDLQTVAASIAVNFHLKPETIMEMYRSVHGNYETTLADPAIQEVVKAVTAQYTADELITKRAEVSSLIQSQLSERLSKYAVVETVSITNFDFSESFNRAIEAKVTAEQDALAAKNKLAQVEYEAEQTIAQAKADAESIRIQAEAITQQGGKEYVDLVIAHQWNGVLPQYVTGDSIPLINFGK